MSLLFMHRLLKIIGPALLIALLPGCESPAGDAVDTQAPADPPASIPDAVAGDSDEPGMLLAWRLVGALQAWAAAARTPLEPDPDALDAEPDSDATHPVPYPGAPPTFADLVDRVRGGVVSLYATMDNAEGRASTGSGSDARGQGGPGRSLGSGFLIDESGHVLTNGHVVDGARRIVAVGDDGIRMEAHVLGVDIRSDLALLRVDPGPTMHPLPLGDSTTVRVGDWVIALGNPFGLTSTVTAGIISALGRRDMMAGERLVGEDMLQTDASINPGNSGGPLVNMHGEVIAVTTARNREGQGISFAIPVHRLGPVVRMLREEGRVERSWLGLSMRTTPSELLPAPDEAPRPNGVLVTRVVPEGPADQAGVRPGDLLLRFGDHEVTEREGLPWLVSMAGVGAIIDLDILRDDERLVLQVTLGSLDEDP